VRKIQHVLIVGVAVDGGHEALLDDEFFVQHLRHRGQAIGGAGSVRDHVVLGRVVGRVVDSQHDGDVLALGRRGNDDFLHRASQVLRRVLGVGEPAGGFHHHLRAQAGPVDLGRVPDRENPDALFAHYDRVRFDLHIFVEASESRIVFEQMRQRLGICKIVGGDNFDVGIVERGAHHVSANPAKSVDCNFDWHDPVYQLVHCLFYRRKPPLSSKEWFSPTSISTVLEQGKIKITPALPPEQFGSCSVDFRLGREFSVFEHSLHAFIDLRNRTAIQD